MVKTVTSGAVRLPVLPWQRFEVLTREEDGGVYFEFAKPIKLPISSESERFLNEEYQDSLYSIMKMPVHVNYRWASYPDLSELVLKVLRRTIPAFIEQEEKETNVFEDILNGNCGYRMARLDGEVLSNWTGYTLGENDRFFIHVDMPSIRWEDLKSQKVHIPEIRKGRVSGYVNVRAGIGRHYNSATSSIIRALANSSPAYLFKTTQIEGETLEDSVFRTGTEHLRGHGVDLVYVQVENPTLERLEQATMHAREIESFYAGNQQVLEEAARLLEQAWNIRGPLNDMGYHQAYIDRIHKLAVGLYGSLPAPAGIGQTRSAIESLINSKLREVDAVLEPLKPAFPRGILEYATPLGKSS